MLRSYKKTLTVVLTALALTTASLAATSDAFAGGGGGGGRAAVAAGRAAAAAVGAIITALVVVSMSVAAAPAGCWCAASWSTSATDPAPHGTPARCHALGRVFLRVPASGHATCPGLAVLGKRRRKSLDGEIV